MACFSLAWIEQVLIWAVIIIAIWSILSLLVPWVIGRMGVNLGEGGAMIMRVLRIILYAIVTIFVIIVVFMLISCLLGFAGGFPGLPRHSMLLLQWVQI